MDTRIARAFRTVSNHVIAEKRQNLADGQNALFASRSFGAGELISDFSAGSISKDPTYLTVQIGVGKHITLQPEFLQYINHGCDPNVFFNTTTMQVIALKEITAGEELLFFYPSTEWKMTQSFPCYCGSAECIGTIKGAMFLTKEQQEKYRLTDFIQQQLAKRAARKVA